MAKELFKGLSEEQIAKVRDCKNSEEILALAKQEGIELTEDQLEAVNGGFCESTPSFICPECGSSDISAVHLSGAISMYWSCTCKTCDHHWRV